MLPFHAKAILIRLVLLKIEHLQTNRIFPYELTDCKIVNSTESWGLPCTQIEKQFNERNTKWTNERIMQSIVRYSPEQSLLLTNSQCLNPTQSMSFSTLTSYSWTRISTPSSQLQLFKSKTRNQNPIRNKSSWGFIWEFGQVQMRAELVQFEQITLHLFWTSCGSSTNSVLTSLSATFDFD